MLVAKLRHKADRESRDIDAAQKALATNSNLKDSKLSYQSKTTVNNYDNEPTQPLESTGGGYVVSP